jgi:ABC-type Fe3+-hydroxamate transport system substrate-binding protein
MAPPPQKLTDARGVAVATGPYRRVVSLVPSLTDAVFGLGAGGVLVGRTIYCVEPRDRVATVPAYGGTKNPDIEGILELAPDLVLACVEENKPEHLQSLEASGTTVFAVMPRSIDDVSGLLRHFGILLGVEQTAGRAMADLTASRLTAGEFRRDLGRSLRTATLIWKNPWMAAGGGNHINAVMQELGLINVLSGREGYFEINLEDLVAENLDLVLLPDEPFPFSHHAAWSMAAAGVVPNRTRAVLLDGKLLTWYGTRTAKSLRVLVKLLAKRLEG